MASNTKIIKHGRFYNKVVRFECECGCVFETSDLLFRHQEPHDFYSAYCPECDAYITKRQYQDEQSSVTWYQYPGTDKEDQERHGQA